MFKTISAICVLLLLASMADGQSTVTVTASHINAGSSPLSAGTILWQAVNGQGQNISYQTGGSGPSFTAPTVCAITNGVITGSPCVLPNVATAVPQNFCFSVTVKNSSNIVVLGGPNSGYQCVQPTINSPWCSAGACNFDLFFPTLPSTVFTVLLPPPGPSSLGGIYSGTCPIAGYAVTGYDITGHEICAAVSGTGATWGSIVGTLANQTDLATILATLAPSNSPSFTGVPTVPTPLTGDSSTTIPNTLWVNNQNYAPLASPALTGTPTAPTPLTADSSTNIATTAWVKAQNYGVATGNVSGPIASIVGHIALFNSTNGQVLSDAGFGFPLARANIGTLAAGFNGLANSAVVDTTNASNISSGTLLGTLLPNPSASVLGGIKSYTAVSNQFITGLSTTGTMTGAQPSCSNLSNAANSCSVDATNASNIATGTLPSSVLPNPLFPSGQTLIGSGTGALPGWAFAAAPAVGMDLVLNPAVWTVSAATGNGSTVTLTLTNTSGWTFISPLFPTGSPIFVSGVGVGYDCTLCIITAQNYSLGTVSYPNTGTATLSSGSLQQYQLAFSTAARRVTMNSFVSSSSGGCPQNGSIGLCGNDYISGYAPSLNYTSTLLRINGNGAQGDLRSAQVGDFTYGAVVPLGAPLGVNGNLNISSSAGVAGGTINSTVANKINLGSANATVDTSGNGVVNNLTINGTCTGCASGSIPYPGGSGIPTVTSGAAWGTTVAAPAGTIVGTTDTQSLTHKTLTDASNVFPTFNQNTTGTSANLTAAATLPNGTAATTQTVGDATVKLATDAFVAAAVPAAGTTATPYVSNGTGAITSPLYQDGSQLTGSFANDWCDKLRKGISNIPAGGAGKIDMSALSGAQTCAVDPAIDTLGTGWGTPATSTTKSVTIVMANNLTLTTNAPITWNGGWKLQFQGSALGSAHSSGVYIVAGSSFPTTYTTGTATSAASTGGSGASFSMVVTMSVAPGASIVAGMRFIGCSSGNTQGFYGSACGGTAATHPFIGTVTSVSGTTVNLTMNKSVLVNSSAFNFVAFAPLEQTCDGSGSSAQNQCFDVDASNHTSDCAGKAGCIPIYNFNCANHCKIHGMTLYPSDSTGLMSDGASTQQASYWDNWVIGQTGACGVNTTGVWIRVDTAPINPMRDTQVVLTQCNSGLGVNNGVVIDGPIKWDGGKVFPDGNGLLVGSSGILVGDAPTPPVAVGSIPYSSSGFDIENVNTASYASYGINIGTYNTPVSYTLRNVSSSAGNNSDNNATACTGNGTSVTCTSTLNPALNGYVKITGLTPSGANCSQAVPCLVTATSSSAFTYTNATTGITGTATATDSQVVFEVHDQNTSCNIVPLIENQTGNYSVDANGLINPATTSHQTGCVGAAQGLYFGATNVPVNSTAPNAGQVIAYNGTSLAGAQAPPYPCSDASGSGTAQVCNTTINFAPIAGTCITYNTTTTNTGALTLNVNSSGVFAVQKWLGSALVAGDLPANHPQVVCLDVASHWQLSTIGNAPPTFYTTSILTSQTSITSTSFVTTGLSLPTLPSGTVKHGSCHIPYGQSTAAVAGNSFGIGFDNAPTWFQVESTLVTAASGSPAVLHNNLTAVGPTAVVNTFTPGLVNTTYYMDLQFSVSTGGSSVTPTIYGLTGNASDALQVAQGASCGWTQ